MYASNHPAVGRDEGDAMGFGRPNVPAGTPSPPEGSHWRRYLLIAILVAAALLVLAALVLTPP